MYVCAVAGGGGEKMRASPAAALQGLMGAAGKISEQMKFAVGSANLTEFSTWLDDFVPSEHRSSYHTIHTYIHTYIHTCVLLVYIFMIDFYVYVCMYVCTVCGYFHFVPNLHTYIHLGLRYPDNTWRTRTDLLQSRGNQYVCMYVCMYVCIICGHKTSSACIYCMYVCLYRDRIHPLFIHVYILVTLYIHTYIHTYRHELLATVDKSLRVIASIRKPKRIGLLGSGGIHTYIYTYNFIYM